MDASRFVRGLLDDQEDPQQPQYVQANDFPARTYGLLDQLFPDPYKAAGDAVKQYQGGDVLGAFEKMFEATPQTGMFVGGKALERAFPGAEKAAVEMERAGKSPMEIAQEKLLHRASDVSKTDVGNKNAPGPWRGEISDDRLRFNMPVDGRDAKKGVKLSDFITHDKAFEAVPELADMKAIFNPKSQDLASFVQPGHYDQLPDGGIVYGPLAFDEKIAGPFANSFVHELNHAADNVTGLPSGGHPGLISSPRMQSVIFDRMMQHPEDTPLGRLYRSLKLDGNPVTKGDEYYKQAKGVYNLLGGEQQAYAAGDRFWMSPDLRRARPVIKPNEPTGYTAPVSEHLAIPQNLWQSLWEQFHNKPYPSSSQLP